MNTSINVVPIHVRWYKNGTIKTKFIAIVFQDVFSSFDKSVINLHKSSIQLQKKKTGCDYKNDTFNLPSPKG